MRGLRWFTLGALAGSLLGLVVVSALYLSPWRASIYLQADPKVGAIKAKLGEYRQGLADIEWQLAVENLSQDSSLPAMQKAQAKAWREYKVWRQSMGEMALRHATLSPSGFASWLQSLWVWILPGALLFTLTGGLISLFFYMRSPTYPVYAQGPTRRPKVKDIDTRAAASALPGHQLDEFQEAVRRIAEIQARSPVRQKAVRSAHFAPTATGVDASELPIPSGSQARDQAGDAAMPQTFTPPATGKPGAPAPKVSAQPFNPEDTAILDVLTGWEGGPEVQPDIPSQVYRPLTMLDQDAPEFEWQPRVEGLGEAGRKTGEVDPETADAEPAWGLMPPTTEFEKLERQKEDVVKLARKGLTSSEISRRLKMGQDHVELIIRMRRERG